MKERCISNFPDYKRARSLNFLDGMLSLQTMLRIRAWGYEQATDSARWKYIVFAILSILFAAASPVLETLVENEKVRKYSVVLVGALNTVIVSVNSLMSFQTTMDRNRAAAEEYHELLSEYTLTFYHRWESAAGGSPVDESLQQDFNEFSKICRGKVSKIVAKAPYLSEKIMAEKRQSVEFIIRNHSKCGEAFEKELADARESLRTQHFRFGGVSGTDLCAKTSFQDEVPPDGNVPEVRLSTGQHELQTFAEASAKARVYEPLAHGERVPDHRHVQAAASTNFRSTDGWRNDKRLDLEEADGPACV